MDDLLGISVWRGSYPRSAPLRGRTRVSGIGRFDMLRGICRIGAPGDERALRRVGRRDQALDHRTMALGEYRRIDMRGWPEQVEAEMRGRDEVPCGSSWDAIARFPPSGPVAAAWRLNDHRAWTGPRHASHGTATSRSPTRSAETVQLTSSI